MRYSTATATTTTLLHLSALHEKFKVYEIHSNKFSHIVIRFGFRKEITYFDGVYTDTRTDIVINLLTYSQKGR